MSSTVLAPERVTTEVRMEDGIVPPTFHPGHDDLRPNGPACPAVSRVAHAVFTAP
jgi:hypothetical protein